MAELKSIGKQIIFFIILGHGPFCMALNPALQDSNDSKSVTILVSFGFHCAQHRMRSVEFMAGSPGLAVSTPVGLELEKEDSVGQKSRIKAGGDDIDELRVKVSWPKPDSALRKMASQWRYLLKHGSKGQATRLDDDTWDQPGTPILTIQLSDDGTKGFSIAMEQLLRHKAMWIPEQDVYITVADHPVDFKRYTSALKGIRTLVQIEKQPEATYAEFAGLWKDFGNPNEWNVPWQTNYLGTEGCLTVTAAAYGSLYKFAIDRWGNARPDFASPHQFRLNPFWQGSQWKGQSILDGLPILVTKLERNGQQCDIEQFAAPLTSFIPVKRGEVSSVLFSKVKLSGKPGPIDLRFTLSGSSDSIHLKAQKDGSRWLIADQASGNIWLTMETPGDLSVEVSHVRDSLNTVTIRCQGILAENESREILLKLPSPALPRADLKILNTLHYTSSRNAVIRYWDAWLKKGAYFKVPEKKVNDLFRANLWHALILPRHRTGEHHEKRIDLPYSNVAYGQKNADWPVNQAVYVDYMIYGLRGYGDVAEDEFSAMFQSQQQPDGRIGGFANWGVYSPSLLYAIAKNYLLTGDHIRFAQLLPQSLKTLDWCLSQVVAASSDGRTSGLILAPLNDLTHANREWAFTQAYFVAGLEMFSRALRMFGNPRAEEAHRAAEKMKQNVNHAFAHSSVQSPLVPLADGTWSNYVPSDAMTPRRLLDEWYPTDVDVGPLHLARLKVINPKGWLTTAMLNDHEDNLYFKNQGAANEPVYVQQGAVYLDRDQPKLAIRSFYSMMACGFSHHQLTPLEHRWAWGQYYGPPSTDGAWFELYRKMLLNEQDGNILFIGQAVPRPWLEDGKRIEVREAPTLFGPVSFVIESQTSKSEISANLEISGRNPPDGLLIRFRHPQKKEIHGVWVNGQTWQDYNIPQEWVHIPKPVAGHYHIVVKY